MSERNLSREEVQKIMSVEAIKSLCVNPRYCLWITDQQVEVLKSSGSIVSRKFNLNFVFSMEDK